MPWDAPTDPDEREIAAAWFENRAAVTKAEYEQLSDDARQRSFTIGGTVQLRVVQTVLSEVKRAITGGDTDLDSFKDRLRERLRSGYVDKNSARLSTAFSTTTQIAYGAGRWAALSTDDALEQYPYRAYSIVMDAKTSKLCLSLRNVVLPSNSSNWVRRWPPLHPHCRTIVIGLTARQARLRGVTRGLPTLLPDDGFGAAPDEEAFWEPDEADFDPQAFAEYKRKLTRMRANDARARRSERKQRKQG
jgi:hypothetical protein